MAFLMKVGSGRSRIFTKAIPRASKMTGRAITVLNDRGHHLRASPPTLIAGDNVTISNAELETLVVPLSTSCGEVIVNVAMETL